MKNELLFLSDPRYINDSLNWSVCHWFNKNPPILKPKGTMMMMHTLLRATTPWIPTALLASHQLPVGAKEGKKRACMYMSSHFWIYVKYQILQHLEDKQRLSGFNHFSRVSRQTAFRRCGEGVKWHNSLGCWLKCIHQWQRRLFKTVPVVGLLLSPATPQCCFSPQPTVNPDTTDFCLLFVFAAPTIYGFASSWSRSYDVSSEIPQG